MSHYENTNQNHDTTLYPSGGYYQKEKKVTSFGKDVEKLEPLCTVLGNVKECNHFGKEYGAFKFKNRISI